MNELVQKLYENQMVSPKSYQSKMHSLRRKFQAENEVLESFRKQAEQMSSILSQIRKDKEEIQDID